MDRRVDRLTRRTNRRVDGRMYVRTDGWMNLPTDGRTDGLTDARTDGRKDGRTDRQLTPRRANGRLPVEGSCQISRFTRVFSKREPHSTSFIILFRHTKSTPADEIGKNTFCKSDLWKSDKQADSIRIDIIFLEVESLSLSIPTIRQSDRRSSSKLGKRHFTTTKRRLRRL